MLNSTARYCIFFNQFILFKNFATDIVSCPAISPILGFKETIKFPILIGWQHVVCDGKFKAFMLEDAIDLLLKNTKRGINRKDAL